LFDEKQNQTQETYKVFAVNPGSTSTKIALFDGDTKIFSANVEHDAATLNTFAEIRDQLPLRVETILSEVDKAHRENPNIALDGVDAFSARCGGLVGCEGGVYELTDGQNAILAEHAISGFAAKHPNNLGPKIALELAAKYGGRVFVVNPPDVDELCDEERITGFKDVFRRSACHALNHKENCIRYAVKNGERYEELNLIVAHIGGGVSVAAHRKGKIISCNDIVYGDGPMAPTRSGFLPALELLRLCFSGEYTEREIYDRITKNGGLTDHLGTSDAREILAKIESGDKYAKLVYDAFIYQIAKAIGGCAAILSGKVDAIILTGGISHDKYLTGKLTEYVGWIATIAIQPGEFEMEALAAGAVRVMSGEESSKTYNGTPVFSNFDYLK